jgi:hypothetical protein
MTLAWIAERLRMGAPGHLAYLLYRKAEQENSSENKFVLTPKLGCLAQMAEFQTIQGYTGFRFATGAPFR